MAEERPLVCLVDDAQWLDRESASALSFVARRLAAEGVAMLFAVREPSAEQELEGLPELVLGGLGDADARLLLDAAVPGGLDEEVRERILAEANGNPLALLELPRGLTPAELAGGFGLPDEPELSSRIEQTFLRRVQALPPETQRALLVAAAEAVGDAAVIAQAAGRLGVGAAGLIPAEDAGLVELGRRVRFRHPLVRSAAYRAATPNERRRAHEALASATDPERDPDRRAWHRAHAAAGADESVAAELERSASRAQARGGVAAAAAFLERAAELSPDAAQRGTRALAAARLKLDVGALEAAERLLTSRRPRRSRNSTAHEPSGCALRSPSPGRAAATRRLCSAPPRSAWNRSTPNWRAKRTWRRSGRLSAAVASPRTQESWRLPRRRRSPPGTSRRARSTCCWKASSRD